MYKRQEVYLVYDMSFYKIIGFALTGMILLIVLKRMKDEYAHVLNALTVSYTHLDAYKRQVHTNLERTLSRLNKRTVDKMKNNNSFFNNKNSFGMYLNKTEVSSDETLKDLPLGLSMAFCQNAAALTAFSNMSEQQRKDIIKKASSVNSKKEMTALVQNIAIHNLPED